MKEVNSQELSSSFLLGVSEVVEEVTSIGFLVGSHEDWIVVRQRLGHTVGDKEGALEGECVEGARDGLFVGVRDGLREGKFEGAFEGAIVGEIVGEGVHGGELEYSPYSTFRFLTCASAIPKLSSSQSPGMPA